LCNPSSLLFHTKPCLLQLRLRTERTYVSWREMANTLMAGWLELPWWAFSVSPYSVCSTIERRRKNFVLFFNVSWAKTVDVDWHRLSICLVKLRKPTRNIRKVGVQVCLQQGNLWIAEVFPSETKVLGLNVSEDRRKVNNKMIVVGTEYETKLRTSTHLRYHGTKSF
jgi:hypothetical protein